MTLQTAEEWLTYTCENDGHVTAENAQARETAVRLDERRKLADMIERIYGTRVAAVADLIRAPEPAPSVTP